MFLVFFLFFDLLTVTRKYINDAQHKILLLSINDAFNPLCYLIMNTHTQPNKRRFNQSIDNSNTVTKERSCVWCNFKIRTKKWFQKGYKKENWNGSIQIFICEIVMLKCLCILEPRRGTSSRMNICKSHLLMCCDTRGKKATNQSCKGKRSTANQIPW